MNIELQILQDNFADLNFSRPSMETLVDAEELLTAEFLHYYSELTIEEQFETYMKEVIKIISYYTGFQLKPMLSVDDVRQVEVNLHAPLYTYMDHYMFFDRLVMWRNQLTEYKCELSKDEPIERSIQFKVSIDERNHEALFYAEYRYELD